MKIICLLSILIIGWLTTPLFAQSFKTDTVHVWGDCIQCRNRIEKALKIKGVSKADWNKTTQLLTVTFDSTKYTLLALENRIASVGHDTRHATALVATYDKLPGCCQYTRTKKEGGITNANTSISTLFNVTGVVLEETAKGGFLPIANATITNLHSGKVILSDSLGVFTMPVKNLEEQIAVGYVGYIPDTLSISTTPALRIVLRNSKTNTLQEVTVQSRKLFSASIATQSVSNTLTLGSKEIQKAACCNLSESFETTPSVDVAYSDAVTGIKQIQLLGLSGNYTLITTENIPDMKGLSGSYGMAFVPGPWLESIQISKGTGSVANGYESITGQINIEEKKPDNGEKLLVNAYANMFGRLEANVNTTHHLNPRLGTTLLAHLDNTATKRDENKDGFMDMPKGHQWNFINRWKYTGTNGLFAQWGVKALNDARQAGAIDFNPATDKLTNHHYGVGFNTEQYGLFGKIGYLFPQKKYKSIGLILSAKSYANQSYYGLNSYDGRQTSLYAQMIFQSILGNTNHKYRIGWSVANDDYVENFSGQNFQRKETVAGAFAEYTYSPTAAFSAIAGVRTDYHNQFGWILTPRLNLKYNLTPTTTLRASTGSGFRVANIFAEHTGLFVSSRQYQIVPPKNSYGYGLQPEKAWNYGANLLQQFSLFKRKGTLSLDMYRTDFIQQTIADVDAHPQQILFYDLQGQSFANSIQIEGNYQLLPRLDVRLAYRWLDVQTTYHGQLLQQPMTAKHRAFVNLAYETKTHWKMDVTTQWIGAKRLPNTKQNPVAFQLDDYSPAYMQLSAQVSKQWGTHWEWYLGGENLTNVKQSQLFIDANHPFGNYFDGSMVWGPVNGGMVYIGMRFKVM